MKEFKGVPALDAGLLAAAQAVEHYEIARFTAWLKPSSAAHGLGVLIDLALRELGERFVGLLFLAERRL